MTKKVPNPIDVFVGSRVRLRRLMVGMSQEALADRLGVTFQQVQKYEKGTNRISASRLQAISDVFRVPPSFFFQDDDSNAPSAGHETGDVSTFVSSKEGLDLNRAFLKIEDAGVRKSIIQLATALSKASAADTAGDRADNAPELRI